MSGPHPHTFYPIQNYHKMVFLKNFISASNIFIGDYTYFDDPRGPEKFEELSVLYNYHQEKVKLVIGKFCAIAAKTCFMMTGDHKLDGISTYPFPIFQEGWQHAYDMTQLPVKGDIIVGDDVWLGYDSFIRGGVKIGNGSIVAAKSVVVKDVSAYSIVAGNPAKVVKMRFDPQTIQRLKQIAWWDWDITTITQNLPLITGANIDQLEAISLTISR